jgi:hypothetical protein
MKKIGFLYSLFSFAVCFRCADFDCLLLSKHLRCFWNDDMRQWQSFYFHDAIDAQEDHSHQFESVRKLCGQIHNSGTLFFNGHLLPEFVPDLLEKTDFLEKNCGIAINDVRWRQYD